MEHAGYPVVGIGASAGGLGAMTALFDAESSLDGMALVIVQHLDPKSESHLVPLLTQHTSLTVRPAQDGLEIEPDHVYVCVPNRDLVVRDGRLRLLDPEAERSQRHPIDRFDEALDAKQRPAITTSGYIKDGDARRLVTLTIGAINPVHDASPWLLVSFEESGEPQVASEPEQDDRSPQSVDQLEKELQLTLRELQEVSDQYDRLLEDNSTSGEEMLSINEELQSANEELESSKEELQSLNEELNTLNDELRSKVQAVEQTNSDLNNLLASTEIATLFLDMDCHIRWFTPATREVLRLIPSDVGRPVLDLTSTVSGSQLESEARKVLETLVPVETEVVSEHRCFIRRILPYRTADNRIDGVVATFVDITDRKRGEQQRERLMHELSHRIKNTLAMVQAIVQGLGKRCDSMPEFLSAFEPRLAALARAHSIFTPSGDDRVGLRILLKRELMPYVGEDSQRVTIEGDDPTLARESAIAMELVFHELVTNATKYGALSSDTGTVTVRCECAARADGEHARIEWIESGGPPIESERESGFGSLLIQSSVSHDLGGDVDMQFEPQGLHCTIAFPLRYNEEKD